MLQSVAWERFIDVVHYFQGHSVQTLSGPLNLVIKVPGSLFILSIFFAYSASRLRRREIPVIYIMV